MLTLSQPVIEVLLECREREISDAEPCDVEGTDHAKELIRLGLLAAEPYISKNGKRFSALKLTQSGREYLQQARDLLGPELKH